MELCEDDDSSAGAQGGYHCRVVLLVLHMFMVKFIQKYLFALVDANTITQ